MLRNSVTLSIGKSESSRILWDTTDETIAYIHLISRVLFSCHIFSILIWVSNQSQFALYLMHFLCILLCLVSVEKGLEAQWWSCSWQDYPGWCSWFTCHPECYCSRCVILYEPYLLSGYHRFGISLSLLEKLCCINTARAHKFIFLLLTEVVCVG